MRNVILGFEVHQPFRIKGSYFWNPQFRDNPIEKYFDNQLNRDVFLRAKQKCYIPATKIILDEIERGENEGYDVKVFYSISGTFMEQAEKWGREVIDLLQQLSYTKKVEFLSQTYYHSITGLWDDLDEWKEQVKQHSELIKEYFNQTPTTFENTELLVTPRILKEVENLGFKSIIMEGKESVLNGRSPNYVYRIKNSKLVGLLRNYRLSDDIAFRFSNRNWDQYPLTAQKLSDWLLWSEGDVGLIFVDYETFGEHHWPESGILDFLRWLPRELSRREIKMRLPKEVYDRAVQEIEITQTSSWADINKDESSWLGNIMQWAYDEMVRRTEMLAKELGKEYLKAWKYFTTSDHYYYLFLGSSSPAEVHSYFSSFNSPIDAFINEIYAISMFQEEMRKKLKIENEPFIFYKGLKRGKEVWTIDQYKELIKQKPEYKDFEKYIQEWIKQ
ncbi:alpha-amylase [Sulfolobus acidocaldarius SUSAZ]|nr:alpha-amylase [Sulfolobus acidocaldarius SUSAZ]